jgi:hypothetical protein
MDIKWPSRRCVAYRIARSQLARRATKWPRREMPSDERRIKRYRGRILFEKWNPIGVATRGQRLNEHVLA